MRAIMDAKEFSEALDKVSLVLKRVKIPVLNTVRLQFGGGRCVLTATDLETWLTAEIPAQGDSFECAFNRNKDAAKTCRYYDGALTLEVEDSGEKSRRRRNILLSCGPRAAEFEGLPPDEIFPDPPQAEGAAAFTVNAAGLLKRVNRVKYALRSPGQGIDPVHTCVQFEKDRIFCVDGYRAACDTDPALTMPRPCLMTGTSLAYLKLFGNVEVSARFGKRHLEFSGEGLTLLCRLVDAVLFRFENAIPREFQEEFTVSPKEFLRELAYLQGLIPPRARSAIRFCGGDLSLEPRFGVCCTSVPLEGSSTVTFGFDPQYMTDALKQFDGEERVKIKVSGQSSPLIIEAEGRGDYALVLPVHLKTNWAAA